MIESRKAKIHTASYWSLRLGLSRPRPCYLQLYHFLSSRAHSRDQDVFIIWHMGGCRSLPFPTVSTVRKQMFRTYIRWQARRWRRRRQWRRRERRLDQCPDVPFWSWRIIKGHKKVIEITGYGRQNDEKKKKFRSEKKFPALREAILRIAPESRAIDEISAVFRESPPTQ